MLERGFFNFLNFFAICFRILLPGLDRNIAEQMFFLIFAIFLLFFLEFSSPGRVGIEFGTNIFFFSFSAYLIPFSLGIMPERGFFYFLNFFAIFFEIFLLGASMNGIL